MQRQDLRNAGLKITLPRLKILEILEETTEEEEHFSAEDIYRKLLDLGEDIGLATVYRVLTQFESADIVVRHNFEGGHSVFELNTGAHHDHIVCVETGNITEFISDEKEELLKKIANSNGFDLVDHSVVLYVKPKSAD